MLISSERENNDRKFEEMRNFMKENGFPNERFRFMYIYREKQDELVKALTSGFNEQQANINKGIHVVIIWRREFDSVFYEWFHNEWDLIDSTYINQTKEKLNILMNKLSENTAQFTYSAKINTLKDESAKTLLTRMVKRLLLVSENISDNIFKADLTPIFSFICSLVLIIVGGYLMSYLM